MEQWPDAFHSCSQFTGSTFFVAKNHLRSSSPSNCSLLCSRFARSCSPRPSQRSKYTEGVALRMRICIAVQRLSRKWVQKKNTPGPDGGCMGCYPCHPSSRDQWGGPDGRLCPQAPPSKPPHSPRASGEMRLGAGRPVLPHFRHVTRAWARGACSRKQKAGQGSW